MIEIHVVYCKQKEKEPHNVSDIPELDQNEEEDFERADLPMVTNVFHPRTVDRILAHIERESSFLSLVTSE
jgi:hypothetical protein